MLQPIKWSYRYGLSGVWIDRVDGSGKGKAKYAIRKVGSQCLNHRGKWEIELQPSSRTDAFLKRCRFDSLAEVKRYLGNL